jgi:hypothetical protein
MTYQAGVASPPRAFRDKITSGLVQTGTNKADVDFGLLAARAIGQKWRRRPGHEGIQCRIDIAADARSQAMGPRERSPIDSITG